MRLSIDMDGVVGNFCGAIAEIHNRMFPDRTLLPENFEPADWNFTDVLSSDEWKRVWEEVKATEDFWLNEPELASEVEALRAFLHYHPDFDVYFITARSTTVGESTLAQTWQWLAQRFLAPRNGHSTVIQVDKAEHKAILMNLLNINFSLDDHGPTVETCLTVYNHRAYLLDRRYNKDFNVPRVGSMAEFLQVVSQQVEEK